MHLKKESHVSDHCMLHGLSDPVNKAFKYTGPAHSHNLRCARCKQLDSTLQYVSLSFCRAFEMKRRMLHPDSTNHLNLRDMVAMVDGVHKNLPAGHGMKKELSEMRLRMEENVEKITEMKKVRHVFYNIMKYFI